MLGIFNAWGKILSGHAPFLSIELTRECPLTCAGCYVYAPGHLGDETRLSDLPSYKGQQLVDGVLALLREHRPLHVSIVGGEPLVRYRELNDLLPRMAAMGIYTQLVTSAVRPIPVEWATLRRLMIVVSIDGLAPEHDARRRPATYERIRRNIEGHHVTIHNTVTRQQLARAGYFDEFLGVWLANPNVHQVWFSLYTPQVGEVSAERLTESDRRKVIDELRVVRTRYPGLKMPNGLIEAFAAPPQSPRDCMFAKTTTCVSCDLETRILPCQFGGNPDCANCGCIAAGALSAVARHRLFGRVSLNSVFDASARVGTAVTRIRRRFAGRRQPVASPADRPVGAVGSGSRIDPGEPVLHVRRHHGAGPTDL